MACSLNSYQPSELGNEEERQKLYDSAEVQRKLGRFNKALELFRAAEAIRGDLALGLDIVGLLLEQGRIPRAATEIERVLETYTSEDKECLAVAQLVKAITSSNMMVLDHRKARDLAVQYFEQHVKPFPVREWKKRKVRAS